MIRIHKQKLRHSDLPRIEIQNLNLHFLSDWSSLEVCMCRYLCKSSQFAIYDSCLSIDYNHHGAWCVLFCWHFIQTNGHFRLHLLRVFSPFFCFADVFWFFIIKSSLTSGVLVNMNPFLSVFEPINSVSNFRTDQNKISKKKMKK